MEFQWDFTPGRDHILVQLTLELRKLPQSSWFLQSARIREGVCPLCVCQTSPGGLIGCSSPRASLEGSSRVWPSGSLNISPRGLSRATPLGTCYVTGRDPSPAHAWGRVTPVSGFLPQAGNQYLYGAMIFTLRSCCQVNQEVTLFGCAPRSLERYLTC